MGLLWCQSYMYVVHVVYYDTDIDTIIGDTDRGFVSVTPLLVSCQISYTPVINESTSY